MSKIKVCDNYGCRNQLKSEYGRIDYHKDGGFMSDGKDFGGDFCSLGCLFGILKWHFSKKKVDNLQQTINEEQKKDD